MYIKMSQPGPLPNGEYMVQRIVDLHGFHGTMDGASVRIRWVGWGPNHDTWEDARDVLHLQVDDSLLILRGIYMVPKRKRYTIASVLARYVIE